MIQRLVFDIFETKTKKVARIFRGIQRWGQVLEFAAKIIGLILKEFKKVIKFL